MTLIVTYINKYGIVHASDSNLSYSNGLHAGESQKTFPIPHLESGLTVAGSYQVGGNPMNRWLNSFIDHDMKSGNKSLELFSEKLRVKLEMEMNGGEKKSGCMIHVAGFAPGNNVKHPEFWFIRNIYGIDQKSGEYQEVRNQFVKSEDFWVRNSKDLDLLNWLEGGGIQVYGNGFASGRIGFFSLLPHFNEYFQTFWSNPNWKFRPPTSIKETEHIVKLYIQMVKTLFLVSDYPSPLIGGEIQTYLIPRANNRLQPTLTRR
jgi:hypothetical protein